MTYEEATERIKCILKNNSFTRADTRAAERRMIMSFREFKNKYFEDWRIAGITTYGNERGYIKLRNKDSFIKLYFKYNGAKYWTDDCVTLEYIEGCDTLKGE